MAGQRQGYGQYCPISRALEVLGERWSLLIVRDLLIGTTRFNELARGLPGLSRALLTKRLRELENVGVLERIDGQYLLTDAGRELEPIVFGIGAWGAKWTFGDPLPEELDGALLVWWMHQGLDTSALPGHRHVLQFRFSDDRRLFWIVIEDGQPSVCLVDPGYPVDVVVRSDLSTMYQVWVGRLTLREALGSARVEFDGPPALTRRMQQVFTLSAIAPAVAAASATAHR